MSTVLSIRLTLPAKIALQKKYKTGLLRNYSVSKYNYLVFEDLCVLGNTKMS